MKITFTPETHPSKPFLVRMGPYAFRVTHQGFKQLERELANVVLDVIDWEMKQQGYPNGAV